MIHLGAAAQHVLASRGFRLEAGENAFYACFLRGGAASPVAWVRAEGSGWQVAIAKNMVPGLANKSLTETATDGHCPVDAAFVVTIPDRDRLYGVFELIATAYSRLPARTPTSGPADAEAGTPRPVSALLTTLDALLDQAEAGHESAATVVKALRDVRIGQNRFREALLARWDNACAVTGLNVPRLLRASHCKPWAVSSPQERLDPNNGLLLAAHLDAAFDAGYVSFADDGAMLTSPQLSAEAMQALGLRPDLRLRRVQPSQRPFLQWHRDHLLLGPLPPGRPNT